MYTRPSHRGSKIGAKIVERVETLARQRRIEARWCWKPATAIPPPGRVYERAGFSRCGPVLDYPDSEWSVFYEKSL